ncbi:MAG: regulatory protein RecX [Candidatus Omnitrophota bacterium]
MKDFNQALSYSFLLLKYRARSRNEIISRLKKKGYTSKIREQTTDYLEKNNYLNDADFTNFFVSYALEKGWGPRRIDFNLKRLGISSSLRKIALEKDFDYNKTVREIILRMLGNYRAKKPAIAAKKIWNRIVTHLVQKGFDREVIYQEMKNLGVDRFEDK